MFETPCLASAVLHRFKRPYLYLEDLPSFSNMGLEEGTADNILRNFPWQVAFNRVDYNRLSDKVAEESVVYLDCGLYLSACLIASFRSPTQ